MKKLICAAAAMLLVFIARDGTGVGPGRTSDCWDIGGGDAEQHGEGGRAVDSGNCDACVGFRTGRTKFAQRGRETYNWHFVDIPRSAAGFDDARDCFKPTDTHPGAATDHLNCVVDRITSFKQVLADTTKTATERQEALQFIVHFVGDVHQPFHAVGDARGANDNLITEFGSTQCGSRPCNLHSAWDSGMITHTGMDVNAYTQHLQELITCESHDGERESSGLGE